MDRALSFIVLGSLLSSVVTSKSTCSTVTNRSGASLILRCTELTNLRTLGRAKSNPTAIQITDSEIKNLPGNVFVRFAGSLKKLDLHGIGIQTMDNSTFAGLAKLEELLLWGNRLQSVYGDCFAGTPNLKTLDVSFNNIQVIDYKVFLMLPNLENFYFDNNQIKFIDYSMLAYLKNLKNVKFEKNPLNWGYRAHLTWQLDNQKVRHREEWEDWAWMNTMIKECAESGRGEIPKDTVLDCVVGELLDFAHEIFSMETRQQKNECTAETERAVRCMRPQNVTGNTDNETIRRILESYVAGVRTPSTMSQRLFSMWFSPY
ncbi:uncharacterized protein LOC143207309 [Lasioglossum baleicum]|uniref:uncharacterized protein LOC143207309 n=1 Tax=Lasioglossum baleicum TaxID=434251 RepID=UPI003FCE4F19